MVVSMFIQALAYWEPEEYSKHIWWGVFFSSVKHIWWGVFYRTLRNTGIFRTRGIFRTMWNIMCSNSPVLNGRLQFWECNSCPPISSRNLPFWDDPGLNVRSLRVFQVDPTFYRLAVKILAANDEISCVRCSQVPYSLWTVDLCQRKHKLFWHKRKKFQ